MCTHPIRILNRKRYISAEHGQQLYMYVPCGHCVECRRQRQNEWRLRSYFESLDTISDGGYMLFDTLTYDNVHLPRLSDFMDVDKDLDFPCFRMSDLQFFMNALRTDLSRVKRDPDTKEIIHPKYDIDGKFRFFIVSEYGTSEFHTKRPHYHIFLFVKDSCVPPLVLSAAIARCWPHGRTDGLPYKTFSYVRQHNTFDTMDISQRRVVMYISKYVCKDFEYSDLVRSRLYKLMCRRYPDFDWSMNKQQREYYKSLLRFVLPFHSQSLHFGESYIDFFGRERLINDGFIKINMEGLPLVFGLFPSLKRKLFYNRLRVDGSYQWFLNANGIDYNQRMAVKRVRDLQNDIDDYNLNHEKKIDFSPFDFLFNHCRMLPSPVRNYDDVARLVVSENSVDCYNGLCNYSAVDRTFLHRSVFSRRDFGTKKRGFSYANRINYVYRVDEMDSYSVLPLEYFERYMLYDESVQKQYEALLDWKKIQGNKKMVVERHNARLKKIYKNLSLC